ncbi:MAG: sulfatase-like hydrolase/transferase [Verrucomicrobiota bacterium]
MKTLLCGLAAMTLFPSAHAAPPERPNVILIFADDISARELPIYGSSVWSDPWRNNTSDKKYLAKTPALDQLAEEGCWITTPWAATVCSPSRAMMMTGRHAHIHKWWENKGKGVYKDENGKYSPWPLYLSSPLQLGHIAQQAGYATYWAGKTQMAGDLNRYGYDRGCFTPGTLSDKDNPYTDFKMHFEKREGERVVINDDTGEVIDTYLQHGWYWFPHVRLMNEPGQAEFSWWPNSEESRKSFGLNTFGPDVELDFIFDYMEEQHEKETPFFIYHCSHLGHDGFDWFHPDSDSSWPGTPVIEWKGDRYVRTEPNVTGDKGVYETRGTVTEPGMHHHINYLDYQVWLYRQKLEKMGIADNTILIFCADNGTGGYGKHSPDRQKGTHVPLIIHAPGMTKRGRQDTLVSMADFLPTLAELTGAKIPEDYEVNGESLVPFLFTNKPTHRDWIYAYSGPKQLIRGSYVLRDGHGKWWDVSETPDDLISFPQITDWSSVSKEHRRERKKLQAILPRYSVENHGRNAPGVPEDAGPTPAPRKKPKKKAKQ